MKLFKRLLSGLSHLFAPAATQREQAHSDFEEARLFDEAETPAEDEIGMKGMVHPRPAVEPAPPRQASQEEIRMIERQLDQKKYVHYLGKFSGMQLEIDQHKLTLTSKDITPDSEIDQQRNSGKPVMKFHGAGKHTSAYFSVEHEDTVYVFWNNPSKEQRAIHAALQEKAQQRGDNATSTHVDLIDMPGGGDFRAHIVPVETYVDGKHVPVNRVERPVFTIASAAAERGYTPRKESEVATPSKLGADWKPEYGSSPKSAEPPRKAPPLQPGFYGPTYD